MECAFCTFNVLYGIITSKKIVLYSLQYNIFLFCSFYSSSFEEPFIIISLFRQTDVPANMPRSIVIIGFVTCILPNSPLEIRRSSYSIDCPGFILLIICNTLLSKLYDPLDLYAIITGTVVLPEILKHLVASSTKTRWSGLPVHFPYNSQNTLGYQ